MKREKELVDTEKWWGLMCRRGIRTFRSDGDKGSAISIISYLVGLRSTAILDVQRELVDEKKLLADTSAGQEVQKELQQQQRKYEQEKSEIITASDQALKDKDRQLAEELLKERQECNKKLLANEMDKQELRQDFQRLKLDREAHFAKMLEEHKEWWEKRHREDMEQWERKSREEKKAREKVEQNAREDGARWKQQSLVDRQALADRDEQYRKHMREYRKQMRELEGRPDDKSDKKQIDGPT